MQSNIKAVLYINGSNDICGFQVSSHGDSIVCAATSMLVINTVNSLETLTDCEIICDYNPDGGYIKCTVKNPDGKASVLLASLALGLRDLRNRYGIKLTEKFQEVT